MKKLILFLLLTFNLYGGTATDNAPSVFISDKDFVEQFSYSDFYKFIKSYSNTFKVAHIKHIYNTCCVYQINPLVVAAKLQQEQSLVQDGLQTNYKKRYRWAMSYCLAFHGKCYATGTSFCPHKGFTNQINSSICRLRELYDNYKNIDSKTILIGWGNDTKKIKVDNASTYALYTYTPIWNKALDGGTVCSGNILFVLIFNNYKKRMKEIKDQEKNIIINIDK